MEDKEKIFVLPDCKHTFHVECLKKWFVKSITCPICRNDVKESLKKLRDKKDKELKKFWKSFTFPL